MALHKPALFQISFLLLLLAGCGTQVERVDVKEVHDLSGAWNDTDSRLVSEEMIEDMVSRAWLNDYTSRYGQKPAVIVGTIRNLSHEHINVNTFVNDIRKAMINSGRIIFVASSVERGEIREERKDQDLHAREDTRKPMGQELGADFMLKGTINTIIDVDGDTQLRYYQVDLNLISLRDNTIVWLGQKKIKKLVSHAKIRP
ncbi:MAG TPA: penicillin-binding protein activator LpoB [Chromatiales bacterium]|nr:penicillin-binding protein activator LpoB [Chromatiales bacterium]